MHRLVFCTLLADAAFARSTQEKQLLDRIDQLEKRLAEPEAPSGASAAVSGAASQAVPAAPPANPDRSILDYLRDLTVNVTIDGYYVYLDLRYILSGAPPAPGNSQVWPC